MLAPSVHAAANTRVARESESGERAPFVRRSFAQDVLQDSSTARCKTAQHVARWHNTLQDGTTRSKTAQHVARQDSTRRCKTAQHVAKQYNTSQNSTLWDTARHITAQQSTTRRTWHGKRRQVMAVSESLLSTGLLVSERSLRAKLAQGSVVHSP